MTTAFFKLCTSFFPLLKHPPIHCHFFFLCVTTRARRAARNALSIQLDVMIWDLDGFQCEAAARRSALDLGGIDSADVSGFYKRQRVACGSRGAWHTYALRGCVCLFSLPFRSHGHTSLLSSPMRRSHYASCNNNWHLVTCIHPPLHSAKLEVEKSVAAIIFKATCSVHHLLNNSVMQTSHKCLFLPKPPTFSNETVVKQKQAILRNQFL